MADKSEVQMLADQRAALQRQIERQQDAQEKFAPKGKRVPKRGYDNNYFLAVDAEKTLRKQMAELDRQMGTAREAQKIKDEKQRERFVERRNEAAEIRDRERKKGQSFAETFPEANEWKTFLPIPVAAATAAMLRAPGVGSAMLGRLKASGAIKQGRAAEDANSFLKAGQHYDRAGQIASTHTGSKGYALPTGLGAVEGAGIANAPYAYDYAQIPEYNPAKSGQEMYADHLLDSDPEKAQAIALAQSMPDKSVDRRNAEAAMTPLSIMMRSGIGAVEGATGGAIGNTAMNALKPGFKNVTAETQAWRDRVPPDYVDAARERHAYDMLGLADDAAPPALARRPDLPPDPNGGQARLAADNPGVTPRDQKALAPPDAQPPTTPPDDLPEVVAPQPSGATSKPERSVSDAGRGQAADKAKNKPRQRPDKAASDQDRGADSSGKPPGKDSPYIRDVSAKRKEIGQKLHAKWMQRGRLDADLGELTAEYQAAMKKAGLPAINDKTARERIRNTIALGEPVLAKTKADPRRDADARAAIVDVLRGQTVDGRPGMYAVPAGIALGAGAAGGMGEPLADDNPLTRLMRGG